MFKSVAKFAETTIYITRNLLYINTYTLYKYMQLKLAKTFMDNINKLALDEAPYMVL